MNVLEGLKLFFGSVFVLLVPGFAWSYMFFNKKSIDWIERTTLSFGLSVALVPLTAFWLYSTLHIGITLLNTSLAVCGLTTIPMGYMFIMKSSLGQNITYRIKSVVKRASS